MERKLDVGTGTASPAGHLSLAAPRKAGGWSCY